MDFAPLAARLLNTPLALDPMSAPLVYTAVADRLALRQGHPADKMQSLGPDFADPDGDDLDRPYDVVQGVAIIPVRGVLIQRLGFIWASDWVSGYDVIRMQLALALRDPDVAAIMFDLNSPGGLVSGCFDLVDAIHAARGVKPIWAILSENAYSAAYAIASAADVITVPRTGGTGSVGVIWMHLDLSKALSDGGISIEILSYGARKADGTPYAGLSDEARARFQADIDTTGEMFVATVARNRGLSPDAVRATEATTFMGQAGVDAGFADAVAAPDAAFRALLATIKQPA